MSSGYLIQSAASLIAIALLVGLAGWARIGRPCPPLDLESAGRLLAEEFPDARPQQIWLSADGRGAVARAGDTGLILFRAGDVYVARAASWTEVCNARADGGHVRLKFREVGAPEARLRLSADIAWPPAFGASA